MTLQLWVFLTVSLATLTYHINKVECCLNEAESLTAQPYKQGIVYPDMDSLSSGAPQRCSWVISSQRAHDVIRFHITDWFGPASHSCTRDYMVVKDGPSPLSPSLRVVCGDTHFKGNVTSTFGAIYIQFHVQVDDASRGFALEYWSVDNRGGHLVFIGIPPCGSSVSRIQTRNGPYISPSPTAMESITDTNGGAFLCPFVLFPSYGCHYV